MIPNKLKSRSGKYSNNVEAAVHKMALDDGGGFGDAETFGYVSFVSFDAKERAALARFESYSGLAAVVIVEDSQGFADFEWFETVEEAQYRYTSLEIEWSDLEDERDEGDGWSPADAFKAGE